MKIKLNPIIFTFFSFFLHCFMDFEYFSVILGGLLTFSKNVEIQDGRSKMAAVCFIVIA